MIASQQNDLGLGIRPFAPPVLDGMPLDNMPLGGAALDDLPLAPLRPAPKPIVIAAPASPKAEAAPAKPEAPRAAKPARQAQPSAAVGQSVRRRRPLSRFVEGDDNPGFYLSLSDLMCLLLVFFVLIFSLTESGASAPAPAQPVAAAPVAKQVVKAAMPLKPLRLADPFPQPEPVPANYRLSMVSVASAGQSDPGLVAEPAMFRGDTGQPFDTALFTLVGSGAPLPASALPDEEPGLEAMLAQGIEVEKNSERVLLRLPEAVTFDLARADIKPGMSQTMARLAGILARHPEVPVVITGHTDDLPISTPVFASNWELSSARASAVGRALVSQGLDESRLTIRGLADRQPRAPNTSESNRGQNRRVEIELRLNS
jgi:chemotaxis protein MotB